ncbi:unnamed protein product [Coffea canephora]|uniref:Uncharacterized protein n=1 Tax=Coffea canephora TaxID=49390 RepID=A0A068UNU6_COFCA|nr:unnamed protein product [Coffea canephora]
MDIKYGHKYDVNVTVCLGCFAGYFLHDNQGKKNSFYYIDRKSELIPRKCASFH